MTDAAMTDAHGDSVQPALLRLDDLVVEFAIRHRGPGTPRRFRAVDGVSLEIRSGEVLGLVGESGSGKTTIGKTLLRLYEPSAGQITFRGADITHMREGLLKPFRRDLQLIFQDPLSSLNPRHTVGEALAVPLLLHRICGRTAVSSEVGRILTSVGLSPAMRDRYPHELSGGQLQRVAIGRALALSPALIVADEPVSKLDVSVRAQILNLFKDIQERIGLSLLFITHDLHVARYLCHRIGVMYFGKLVELAPTETLFNAPRHPYTEALLGTLDDELRKEERPERGFVVSEDLAGPSAAIGCRYYGRCPIRREDCATAHPPLEALDAERLVACYERGSSPPAARIPGS